MSLREQLHLWPFNRTRRDRRRRGGIARVRALQVRSEPIGPPDPVPVRLHLTDHLLLAGVAALWAIACLVLGGLIADPWWDSESWSDEQKPPPGFYRVDDPRNTDPGGPEPILEVLR